MKLPPGCAEGIEGAVGEAEELTSVELVFMARAFSGSYRDVGFLFGLACAVSFLGWALFGERAIPEGGVIPSLALVWLAGWGLSRLSPHLRRLMTSPERRQRQARDQARLSFLDHGVDRTRARTGLLIHVSFLEKRVDLVADRGIQEEFGPDELEAMAAGILTALGTGQLEALTAALKALGEHLGRRLPPDEDNPDELPNAPILEGAA